MQYNALLLVVRCNYTILRAIFTIWWTPLATTQTATNNESAKNPTHGNRFIAYGQLQSYIRATIQKENQQESLYKSDYIYLVTIVVILWLVWNVAGFVIEIKDTFIVFHFLITCGWSFDFETIDCNVRHLGNIRKS